MSLSCAEISPPAPVGYTLMGQALKGIFKPLKTYKKKNNANYGFPVNSYLFSHGSKHAGIDWKILFYIPLRLNFASLKYYVSQMAECRNSLVSWFRLG